ncbi:MAG: hypothetical protein HN350_15410, partial [Phycisphaerales bacterium]|nr:hypothetical protein [Phycisphaerales bacterium]
YRYAHRRDRNRFEALVIANGFSLIFAWNILAIAHNIYDPKISYVSALYNQGMVVFVVAVLTLAPAFLIGAGVGYLSVPRGSAMKQIILTVAAYIAITVGIAMPFVLFLQLG